MFGLVRIHQHELGLHFRHGDFHGLLRPGKHRFWSRLYSPTRDQVQIVNTLQTRFTHPLLDMLAQRPDVREVLLILDLSDVERALVFKDDRLEAVCGPGRHAFFRTPFRLRVETYNINEFRFEHPQLDTVLAHPEAGRHLHGVEVQPHQEAVLFRDGKQVGRLSEGRHVFFKGTGRIEVKAVDRREQVADVAGQEIMTADKVTLRVNLLVTYQVVDVLAALTVAADHAQALYREAQLALRAAVGGRTLDALLADKNAVGNEVRDTLAERVKTFGVAVRSVGLRDLILPGDMKAILNQVIEAEKQAEANLIRRREETAAARSQANTARLLAENPALARIRELEALQEILAGVKAQFVFGSGDLITQLRGLIQRDKADDG